MFPLKTSLPAPSKQPQGFGGLGSLFGQPEGPRPSIWDGLQGRSGILGWLGDPQHRARLAYGLTASSLNPDEALLSSLWERGGFDQHPPGSQQRFPGLLGLLAGVGQDGGGQRTVDYGAPTSAPPAPSFGQPFGAPFRSGGY